MEKHHLEQVLKVGENLVNINEIKGGQVRCPGGGGGWMGENTEVRSSDT